MIAIVGPQEKWEHDLRKLNRYALIDIIEYLRLYLSMCDLPCGADYMSVRIEHARTVGRLEAAQNRYELFTANPDKDMRESARRSKSAKAAARHRKKERS